MKLEKFSWEWFGEARAVTVTKEKTTIVDGRGDEEKIQQRIEQLQSQTDSASSPFEVEQLQNRLAKMVGGVSIIHVGGYNETEMNEKKDRVDDALNATQAALGEGIVPGGGVALLYARNSITRQKSNIGANIVYKACGKPFSQILLNAGYDAKNIKGIMNKLPNTEVNSWEGYNIKSEEIVNMKKEGIIDPTKVTRTALENAASVAGTVLLTECVVVEENQENAQPNMMY